jgi:predicted secreted protein
MQTTHIRQVVQTAKVLVASSVIWTLAHGALAGSSESIKPHFVDSNAYAAQQSPILHLSAAAQTEVRQDWLLVRLQARHQAADAATVQRHLQSLQDRALTAIRPEVNDEQFQLQTGSFRVYPRYGQDGKIQHWEGVSELMLQGRDVPRITRVAANTRDWTVADMHFVLSRQAREQAEQRLLQDAINQFNTKAQALANGFGFKTFDLHEVQLNADGHNPMPAMLRMSADGMQRGQVQSPLSAEPGLSPVSINLSGAVRLRQ